MLQFLGIGETLRDPFYMHGLIVPGRNSRRFIPAWTYIGVFALKCDENLLFLYLLPLRVCLCQVTDKYSTSSIKEERHMSRDDCSIVQ